MAFVRVDMKSCELHWGNFLRFLDSEECKRLNNDWRRVQAMRLDFVNDRRYFDVYYNQSLKIADYYERMSFLLVKMYTSKYQNLIIQYPSIENYFKFILGILTTRIRLQLNVAIKEQLNANIMYNELINFHSNFADVSRNGNFVPADFAVLFVADFPDFGPVDFYRGPPGMHNRSTSYKGVIISFSRDIICEVIEDERAGNIYTHLKLPESVDNCITSLLPSKYLTREIKGWSVPTPYILSASRITETISIGPRGAENFNSLRLCSIDNLKIYSYDTNDLDIRTFANDLHVVRKF